MKTISIWSDYACPFCYIGERRLKDAIKSLGVENEVKLEYKAFELNPQASLHHDGNTEELLALKYGISKEEAKKRIENIDELGRELGIDMKFGKVIHTNTLDAHLLMKFAESQYESAVADALNEALFEAYFVKNQSLSDRKLLLKIAEDCGVDPLQAKEVLDQGLYTDDVRYDERQAASMGVRGVPYMVFDGRFAVPGAVSTEDFKTVVREMLAKEKPNDVPEGKVCDENGCQV